MNKSEVGLSFDLLDDKMGKLNLTNEADRIFNIDESGFQLNTSRFVRHHSRAFTRVEFGDLLNEAWERVATVGLTSNSFHATSMWPVNRNAIPDRAFISEVIPGTAQDSSTCQNPQSTPQLPSTTASQSRKTTSGPPQSSNPHPTTTAPQLPSTANQITPKKYSQHVDEPSTPRRAVKARPSSSGGRSKPFYRCHLRIQCMRIKLQNYDTTLRYVPGKELVIPDAMSRASGPDTKFKLQEQEIAAQQASVVHHIHASQNTLAELQLETQNDETLDHIKTIIMNGISKEIQDMVDNCITCRAAQNLNSREPQINKEIPDRPWKIVAADIFHFQGKDYLLMVDAYSKYPEFSHLTNLSLTQLVTHCKTIMVRHGIPETLYSDNGP
ncbi:hypothetical protein PR048_021669 [Dryococelus australis]|uniref:Integrase catalytic domain-containing protein n=1 Tax=Dryococelus australis TaxID=614101 RepID=A0ABQ9GYV3_9NEOP|nr:hypothetical protein PR048_021669 [Dryococelus australis]